ncbi:hypothetical protein [Neolewinella agarilytica]|uniref:Por secretion system C-terminal sorting domain-containing protein n=1 Tax=Neolewinella agarilytica TaxID=478744 RepID=A0A1H9H9F3_9BACT|nr:hypothetical protein [Neolewinella agarilytica]SEQ59009.1 Por secretion system C-terminal sorting domain-containing protein [Neolewinella agarilytica]
MIRFLLFLVLLFLGLLVEGQTVVCNNAANSLNTQADVDALGALNCTEINGRLGIYGSDITDLTPLSSITSCLDLVVANSSLTTLDGLENVEATLIEIRDNDLLTDIDAVLGNDTLVALRILRNDNLTTINWPNLKFIDPQINGDFHIIPGNGLSSVSFPNLERVEGRFILEESRDQGVTYDFSSLRAVRDLTIEDSNLSDLSAFPSLEEVDDFNLLNTNIPTLSGLSSLTTINRDLVILRDEGLTNLDGMPNLVSVGRVIVGNNANLTSCAISAICDLIEDGGSSSIGNNGPGCNSVAEVEAACLTALPVTWQSFTARAVDKGVQLRWSTTQEENNTGYTVEHSLDGIAFQPTQHLRPRPQNAGGIHEYDWWHPNRVGGTHYYRIRQEDYDGEVSYSEVREIRLVEEVAFEVYPTVVRDLLTIRSAYEQTTVRIRSMNGQVLLTQRLNAGVHQLSLHTLAAGMYLVDDGVGGVHRVIR